MSAERIVCLTEETTETLYLLEEEDRIVGISGYTERPPRARQEKPVIAAFTTARVDAIVALRPDLVLGFSDLQADVCAELVRRGIEVHVFNQRSVDGILRMIDTLGGLIDRRDKSSHLIERVRNHLEKTRVQGQSLPRRPKVFFEEWDDPLISGIGWVSELIEIAGGRDCFAELATHSLAKDRIIQDPAEVITRDPEIIVGSWCGKRFQPEVVAARAGWSQIAAVRNNELHEIHSSLILQPGPAPLLDGVSQLHAIIERSCRR